jgi:hypothetical protein
MKINNCTSIIIAITTLLAVGLMVLADSTKGSYDQGCDFNKVYINQSVNKIHAKDLVKSDTDFAKNFPYNLYANSANWKTLKDIANDLKTLDSLGISESMTDLAISEALTSKLKDKWQTQNLDSIHAIMNWAIPFFYYGKSGQKHALLFQTIGDFWLGFSAERLQDIAEKDDYSFLNCRFKYLRMQTCHLVGSCGDKQPNSLKIVKNITESKWSYLLTRFWTHTGIIFKIFSLMILLIILFALFHLIRSLKKKI